MVHLSFPECYYHFREFLSLVQFLSSLDFLCDSGFLCDFGYFFVIMYAFLVIPSVVEESLAQNSQYTLTE